MSLQFETKLEKQARQKNAKKQTNKNLEQLFADLQLYLNKLTFDRRILLMR